MSIEIGTEKHKFSGMGKAPVNELEFHEAANIFPMMNKADLETLANDIERNSLKNPIILSRDGRVVDGRNRIAACKKIGVTHVDFETVDLEGEELVEYVISLNLHRRHLTQSQRADIAARLANGTRGGDRSKPQNCALTQEQAARQMNVSERATQAAKFVHEHGIEQLQNAVRQGEVAVSAAATIAKLPQETQREVVAEGPKAVKAKAKEVRETHSCTSTGSDCPKAQKSPKVLLKETLAAYWRLPEALRIEFIETIAVEDPVWDWLKDMDARYVEGDDEEEYESDGDEGDDQDDELYDEDDE